MTAYHTLGAGSRSLLALTSFAPTMVVVLLILLAETDPLMEILTMELLMMEMRDLPSPKGVWKVPSIRPLKLHLLRLPFQLQIPQGQARLAPCRLISVPPEEDPGNGWTEIFNSTTLAPTSTMRAVFHLVMLCKPGTRPPGSALLENGTTATRVTSLRASSWTIRAYR